MRCYGRNRPMSLSAASNVSGWAYSRMMRSGKLLYRWLRCAFAATSRLGLVKIEIQFSVQFGVGPHSISAALCTPHKPRHLKNVSSLTYEH